MICIYLALYSSIPCCTPCPAVHPVLLYRDVHSGYTGLSLWWTRCSSLPAVLALRLFIDITININKPISHRFYQLPPDRSH